MPRKERKMMTGDEAIAEIRAKTDTILLAFSCGKDSIGTWLCLRRHFDPGKIVPYYMQLIPELEFVEEQLRYYEGFFGRHIIRMIHPSFYRWLNGGVFQAPQNLPIIRAAGLPTPDYQDVNRWICEDLKLPRDTWCANGVRAADSPYRMMALRRYGPINHLKRTFMPICDWKKQRLYDEIKAGGVKLPVDYRIFGRTFDGIDFRFLAQIKEHFPQDYQTILDYFPLAELEIKRREYAGA